MKKKFSTYILKRKNGLNDLPFIRNKKMRKKELLLYFHFSFRFSTKNIYKCLICDKYCVTKELKFLKCQNKNHFSDHPFGVNFSINIPIFKFNWSFQDEEFFSDCLSKKEVGNWEKVSKWLKNKKSIDCEVHYQHNFENISFDYYFLRGKIGFLCYKNKKNNLDNSDLLKNWDLRVENLFNWTPQRGEFLSDYKENFEGSLKRLDVRRKKKILRKNFIILLLLKYNKRLYLREIMKKHSKRQNSLFQRKFKKINNKIDLKGVFSRLILSQEDFKNDNFLDYYQGFKKKKKFRYFFLKNRNIVHSNCKKFFSGIFRNKYNIRFKEKNCNGNYTLNIRKFFAIKKSEFLNYNRLTKKETFICKLLGLKPFRYLILKNFLFFLIFIKNGEKKNDYDLLISSNFRIVILFEFLIHSHQIRFVKSKQKKS